MDALRSVASTAYSVGSSAVSLGSQAWSANSIKGGLETIYDNATAPGGTALGAMHGALQTGMGIAALTPGLSTMQSIGSHVLNTGIQAYRDAHDMTSEQVSQTLQTHQGSFTANQMNAVQEARRLYTFAKARANLNPNVSDDAMRGGHLVIQDAGAFDNLQRAREGGTNFGGDRRGPNKAFYNLPSSHYPGSLAQQSELQMPSNNVMNFGTMLHGTTPAGHSWMQMEAHSGVWTGSGGIGRFGTDVELHATDFLRHKATGRQVGPLGTSPVMENAPLVVTQQELRHRTFATAIAGAAGLRNQRVQAVTPGMNLNAHGQII